VSDLEIRPATEGDALALADIYNHYILNSHATFDLEAHTAEQRREWLSHYSPTGRHRALVAVEAETVVGFATSSPWRPRPAYATSIETSVYLAPDVTGRGIGNALYTALFEALAGEDIHRVYAGIALPNDPSVALHERFGFHRAGLFTEQGHKFGRWVDVAWYERPF
jgi:phosphinothricin acetyltransferase